MRSSTSSSDAAFGGDTALQRMPRIAPSALLVALAVLAFFVGAMELRLAARGIQPTADDSEDLWLRERARASRLGDRAIILIGSSRVQTGFDLDVLHARTGLTPVQLAIDGNSFMPILDGLARDPAVRGTVIVGFVEANLVDPRGADVVASHYEARFEATNNWTTPFSFNTIEGELTEAVRSRLRSYADGIRPLTSLTLRILPQTATPQYAVVLSDRSRLVDYSHLDQRMAYYSRVMRELGQQVAFPDGTGFPEIDAELTRRIEALEPAPIDEFARNADAVAANAAKIEARGGHVYFVEMPKAGLVARREEKRFPRATFWEHFAAEPNVHALNFEDVPAMKALTVPDGSHVDYRSRAALTNALIDALMK